MITLEIKNVPEDKSLQEEIMQKADEAVREYLERTIIVKTKMTEFNTAITAFRTANKITKEI